MNERMWFVTIERDGRHRQQRLMRAVSAEDAGEKTKALVGGPMAHNWTVTKCVAADAAAEQVQP